MRASWVGEAGRIRWANNNNAKKYYNNNNNNASLKCREFFFFTSPPYNVVVRCVESNKYVTNTARRRSIRENNNNKRTDYARRGEVLPRSFLFFHCRAHTRMWWKTPKREICRLSLNHYTNRSRSQSRVVGAEAKKKPRGNIITLRIASAEQSAYLNANTHTHTYHICVVL